MKIKNYIALTFCLLVALTTFAQDVLNTYENTYYGKKYNIDISVKGNNYSLWINAISIKDTLKVGGFVIREKNFFNFLESLKMAKLKYEDCCKVAKRDGVKRDDISMRIYNNVDVFIVSTTKYIFLNTPLDFNFKVRQRDGQTNYLLFLNSADYSIVFTSSAEIQEFIDKFSSPQINDYVVKNQDLGPLSSIINVDDKHTQLTKNGPLSAVTLALKVNLNTYFGVNDVISNNSNDLLVRSSTSTLLNGFGFGAFARIPFKSLLIQPEITYSMGKMKNSMYLSDADNFNELTLSQLNIPILFGCRLFTAETSSLRVLLGPNFILDMVKSSSFKTTHFIRRQPSSTITQGDFSYEIIHPFKLGIATGLEYDFLRLTVGARFNYVGESYSAKFRQISTITNFTTNSFEFSLGWKLFYPKK